MLFANATSEKDGNGGNTSSLSSTRTRVRPKMPPNVGFVDLRTNYDEVLFDRFYAEMMIPGFPDPDGKYSRFSLCIFSFSLNGHLPIPVLSKLLIQYEIWI